MIEKNVYPSIEIKNNEDKVIVKYGKNELTESIMINKIDKSKVIKYKI